MTVADFTWRDGERLIRFGRGALAEAPELIERADMDGFTLLTTERGQSQAPELAARAAAVIHVPGGRVDELSASLLEDARERPLVALGGGRVIDTAKAIAGVGGAAVAALPTTLSGAELAPFHRTPKGMAGASMVRPSLVVADPALMASQPTPALAASAMNALAHGMESLYTPLANPVAGLAALRGATLIAAALAEESPNRDEVALGALLCGYASASSGIAVHHALCQSLVRTAGSPHAETNAVILPHTARLMAPRAPAALAALGTALGAGMGAPAGSPVDASSVIAELSARCGYARLAALGVRDEQLQPSAAAALGHPAYSNTPEAPSEQELLGLLRAAL